MTAQPGWCTLATDPGTAPALGVSGSVIDSDGAAFFCSIVGEVTGGIVWHLQWTPVEPVSGTAPGIGDWDGVEAYVYGTAGPWPTGTAILTATMGGVPLPGYLRLVFSAGGYGSYGSAAWDSPVVGTGPGWNLPITGSGNPIPAYTGSMERHDNPDYGLDFVGYSYGAGIAGVLTGDVEWTVAWTPVDEGDAPTLTYPAPGLVLMHLPPRGNLWSYPGTVVLTATMGGVGFDHALRMAVADGGFGNYGVLAWDRVPIVDPGGPGGTDPGSGQGYPSHPCELPGPTRWQETPADRRTGSGLRESSAWRPRSREYRAEAAAEWIYTAAEMAVWLAWFETTARRGLAVVSICAPGVGGLGMRVVKYQDGTVQRKNLGNGNWSISATMDVHAPLPGAVTTTPCGCGGGGSGGSGDGDGVARYIAWAHPIWDADGPIDLSNTGLGSWQQVSDSLYAGVVDYVGSMTVVWSIAWDSLDSGDVREPTLTDQPGGKVAARLGDSSPDGYPAGTGVLSATVNGTPAVNTLRCVVQSKAALSTEQLLMLTTVGLPTL